MFENAPVVPGCDCSSRTATRGPFTLPVVLIKVAHLSLRCGENVLTRTEIDVLFGRLVSNGIFILKRKCFPRVVVTEEEIKRRQVCLPHQHITAVSRDAHRSDLTLF